jgi:hypothetical protein
MFPGHANADDGYWNLLAGPVVGFEWGGKGASKADTPAPESDRKGGMYFGWEAGIGWPQKLLADEDEGDSDVYVLGRANIGQAFRSDEVFSYATFDPWWVVGATGGVGWGSKSGTSGIVGLWEGVPLIFPDEGCGADPGILVSMSLGYRYSGVHEIYFAPKIGMSSNLGIGSCE